LESAILAVAKSQSKPGVWLVVCRDVRDAPVVAFNSQAALNPSYGELAARAREPSPKQHPIHLAGQIQTRLRDRDVLL
jgi:hypothetical protein